MKKFLLGLAALPFCAGIALAGQPLSNHQMDQITGGFTAVSIADAQGLVGSGTALLTTTASLSQVNPYASASIGETSVTLYKSLAAAQSSSVSTGGFTGLPIVSVDP